MIWLLITALLPPSNAGDASHTRLSASLKQAALWSNTDVAAHKSWVDSRSSFSDAHQVTVVVHAEPGVPVATSLAAHGLEIEVDLGSAVQVAVPYGRLHEVAEVDGVQWVREPHLATPKGVVTEGLPSLMGENWPLLEMTGDGIDVAIVDVGFAGYRDLLGVELPDNVALHFEEDRDWARSAHGTAVSEVIHDLAPDARLHLYLVQTSLELLEVTRQLEVEPVHIVNASLGFDNIWHADGTSPLSQAVDALVSAGTVWIQAAGNENLKYQIGELTDTDTDSIVETGGQEGVWVWAPNNALDVSFRWSDPMRSAHSNLDLVAWYDDGSPCASSANVQGHDGTLPYESIRANCGQEWVFVTAVIDDSSTLGAGLNGFLYGANGIDASARSESQTLSLPADASNAITVAACDPLQGTGFPFSSRGPTWDGRLKPDVCAPTAVSTASFGNEAFFGTSASAAHVTGLTTLAMAEFAIDDPNHAASWLLDNAQDLGEPGKDTVFGEGAARFGPAPSGMRCSPGSPPKRVWLSLVVWMALHWLLGRVASKVPSRNCARLTSSTASMVPS